MAAVATPRLVSTLFTTGNVVSGVSPVVIPSCRCQAEHYLRFQNILALTLPTLCHIFKYVRSVTMPHRHPSMPLLFPTSHHRSRTKNLDEPPHLRVSGNRRDCLSTFIRSPLIRNCGFLRNRQPFSSADSNLCTINTEIGKKLAKLSSLRRSRTGFIQGSNFNHRYRYRGRNRVRKIFHSSR